MKSLKFKHFFILLLLLTFSGKLYGPFDLFAQIPYKTKLTPDEVKQNDAFGDAVVIDGDYLMVGAFLDNNEHGTKAGAAYIFQWNGTAWVQQAKLIGSDVDSLDRLGESIAIDGEYAFVGPVKDDDAGIAYVFKRDGETWTQQAKLIADDLPVGETFGRPISIQDDYAFISAGVVRIFKRDGAVWTQQDKLTTDTGDSVNLERVSGDHIITSRSFFDSTLQRSVTEAYIFKRNGQTWTQQAKLVGSDAGRSPWFRLKVAISGDYLAIGSGLPNVVADTVYIFKQETSGWQYQTKFVPQDATTFGFSISKIAMEGEYLVVGDHIQNIIGEASGAAYLFRREGENWLEQAKLVPDDNIAFDRFGFSVAIEGDNILVGQDGHIVGNFGLTGLGSVYVYSLTDIIATSVDDIYKLPEKFKLSQNYPNPFNPSTTITYALPKPTKVTLKIYNILGEEIKTLEKGFQNSGIHSVAWDGKDNQGDEVASGLYIFRISSVNFAQTRKMILLR